MLDTFEHSAYIGQAELRSFLTRKTAGERDMLFLVKLGCLLAPVFIAGQIPAINAIDFESTRIDLSRKEQETLSLWLHALEQMSTGCPLEDLVDKFRFLQMLQAQIIGLWLLYVSQPEPNSKQAQQLEHLVQEWLNPDSVLAHPPQLLSGHDILMHLKQKPGPQIGMHIQSIKEAQVQGLVFDKHSALDYLDGLAANHT